MNPKKMLIIASVMLVVGAVLPFLILIHLVPSTFLLNFLSYGVSVGGLFLGTIGIAHYVRKEDGGQY